MNMIKDKTEVAELKPETLQILERLEEDVDVDLFSKTVVSGVGDKHHSHPIIACVTRNLFRVTTTYNSHNFCISCRAFVGHTKCGVSHATKKILFSWRKRDATFHPRVLR
jgi:hypothetical protein